MILLWGKNKKKKITQKEKTVEIHNYTWLGFTYKNTGLRLQITKNQERNISLRISECFQKIFCLS